VKKLVLIFVSLAAVLLVVSCAAEPEQNPFVIGQTIYVADDFYYTLLSNFSEEMVKDLETNGAQVVDITAGLVRYRLSDGSESMSNWRWFTQKEDLVLTDNWVLGNPFSVGQRVCAVANSIRERFPDEGIVDAINGSLLRLKGYREGVDGWIGWAHFQECR